MNKGKGKNILAAHRYSHLVLYSSAYNDLADTFLEKNTNGWGSGWSALVVPDEILNVRIRICCTIHDLDYMFEDDRKESDKRLKRNIIAVTNAHYRLETENRSWWSFGDWDDLFEARARRRSLLIAARIYYRSVRLGGQSAWDNGHKLL